MQFIIVMNIQYVSQGTQKPNKKGAGPCKIYMFNGFEKLFPSAAAERVREGTSSKRKVLNPLDFAVPLGNAKVYSVFAMVAKL